MPHVIVKLWPGNSQLQKARLADAIAKDVMDALGFGEESVSVSMEEVEPQDWLEKVYQPDIVNKPKHFTRSPTTTRRNCHDREYQRPGVKRCEELFSTARATNGAVTFVASRDDRRRTRRCT